jgi:hypothetical protein
MSEVKETQSPEGLPLLVDPDIARGRYANVIKLDAKEEEFVLDFISQSSNDASLVSRIFITPSHAQRLRDLLDRQLVRHAEQSATLDNKRIQSSKKAAKKTSKKTKKKTSRRG